MAKAQKNKEPEIPAHVTDVPAEGEAVQQQKKPDEANTPPPPAGEPMNLSQAKKLTCEKLTKLFSNDLMNDRLLKMAGGDASRVAKNLTAFLSLITEDDGGSRDHKKKKYLYQCSIQSLTTCFLESMNMQLPFDSRKLVSIIIYDWEATLDISYKGFVNALNKHYSNAFVECKLVFEDDVFHAHISGRTASYDYQPRDPFAVITPDFKGIRGGYCFFSYTDTDGKQTSRLVFLSKAQILKNRDRALQHYVWNSDPKAMAEKTCIREGARLPFAAIDLDMDIEAVDNKHYLLERPENTNRIENLMKAQEEVVNGEKTEAHNMGHAVSQNEGAAEIKKEAGSAPTDNAGATGDTKGNPEKVKDETGGPGSDDPVSEGDAEKLSISDADFENIE